MQQPTSEGRCYLKTRMVEKYNKEDIPPLHHVIQSYDTAFMKKESATILLLQRGVFFIYQKDSPANLLLLDAIKGRYEFPELRRLALQQYKYWQPESVIVEAKHQVCL